MSSGNAPAEVGPSFWSELGTNRRALTIATFIIVVAATFVTFTLRRPEPPTFAPSPREPTLAGARLVGPRTFTVDAREPTRWQFFSFAQGTILPNPAPSEWDLAFRRFQVIVNGGEGFPGMGGVIGLGEVPFDSVSRLPDEGYQGTVAVRGDSIAPVLKDWYTYSYFSHLLNPVRGVYALRTADGRYAKLHFLGYYCLGARPGCVTFEYVYQGAGGREAPSIGSMSGG